MYKFKVSGMACGRCANSITAALNTADPSARVMVDLSSQSVQVESRKDIEEISSTIEHAGYPVLESVVIVKSNKESGNSDKSELL